MNREAFGWRLRCIEMQVSRGELAAAARSIADASQELQHCGQFANQSLERLLLEVGARLFESIRPWRTHNIERRRVWHVTTEIDSVGGHSVAIERWIKSDKKHSCSILVTSQVYDVPVGFIEAVESSGGSIYCCRQRGLDYPIEAAQEIRDVLDGNADAVVLQLYSGDISGLLAVSQPGGPVVVSYNTADHKACFGVGVSDLFLEIRKSGLLCTNSLRGCTRTEMLPILVQKAGVPPLATRAACKRQLNIPDSMCCLLSIGSAYKYRPLPGLSFVDCAVAILERAPEAMLLVVGPTPDADWGPLIRSFPDRARLCGRVEGLAPYYAAADVYLEGFPFGSLTALLDARESGLPCVLSPKPVFPPYSSDGPGLDDLTQPCSPDDYIDKVCMFVGMLRGQSLFRSSAPLMRFHHSDHWQVALDRVMDALPGEHRVYDVVTGTPPEWFVEEFWPSLLVRSNSDAVRCNLWARLLFTGDDEFIKHYGRKLVSAGLKSAVERLGLCEYTRLAVEEIVEAATHRFPGERFAVSPSCYIKLLRVCPRLVARRLRPIVGLPFAFCE